MQRDLLLIEEMADAGRRIIGLLAEGAGAIANDRTRLEAVLWNFTVLGEAAVQVSSTLKAGHPAIVWSDPIRLRNRVVHGYWSVDLEVLVSTARDDMPALVSQLDRLQRKLRDADDGEPAP